MPPVGADVLGRPQPPRNAISFDCGCGPPGGRPLPRTIETLGRPQPPHNAISFDHGCGPPRTSAPTLPHFHCTRGRATFPRTTGFCARERRRSVPNHTTFTPPLGLTIDASGRGGRPRPPATTPQRDLRLIAVAGRRGRRPLPYLISTAVSDTNAAQPITHRICRCPALAVIRLLSCPVSPKTPRRCPVCASCAPVAQ